MGNQKGACNVNGTSGRASEPVGNERVVRVGGRAGDGAIELEGNLTVPQRARGVVLFAHGSGSSRHSPRNRYVAEVLQKAGLGTLLVDLLTPEEEQVDLQTAQLRFDIGLLADRLLMATRWLHEQAETRDLRVGYFGASTGGGAALLAAAQQIEGLPQVGAVVSRGGRPDLAGAALGLVTTPTLLIVGGNDTEVIRLNEQALARMSGPGVKEFAIVPGATHLFEEAGALEQVARLARDWFLLYLGRPTEDPVSMPE
jgi:dienelactone hydrolase